MAAVILIAYDDEQEPHLIRKPENYPALLDHARRSFPELAAVQDTDISFRFKPEGFNVEAKLDPSAYDSVQDRALLRIITTGSPANQAPTYVPRVNSRVDGAAQDRSIKRAMTWARGVFGRRRRRRVSTPSIKEEISQEHDVRVDDDIFIFAKTMTGVVMRCPLPNLQVEVSYVFDAAQKEWGIPPDRQRWVFRGLQLAQDRTLESYGVASGSTLYLVGFLRGAKPAVYLLSRDPISEVSVTVELSPQWEPSVLYPMAKMSKSDKGEGYSRATWDVSIDKDGYIVNKVGGLQHTYLFWEATSRDYSPLADASAFDPSRPTITPQSSVVLCFGDVVPYLERTLQQLKLTPAMRHEFMVYWMPHFVLIHDEGFDIAVSFVPQDAFEKAAKLTITPEPATVARVFMLFGGVNTTQQGGRQWMAWEGLKLDLARAYGQVDWAQKIGLDVKAIEDESQLRVLEWGGMEIPSHMLMDDDQIYDE